MMLFKKILVAYDGSNLSKKALARAVELLEGNAEEGRTPHLEVIYIHHDPALLLASGYAVDLSVNDYIINEAKKLVPPSIQAEFVVQRGQPAYTILKHAEANGFDLIVMGSRGRGAIREFILGSVSHNVVQYAKIPVLIVK